MRTNSMRHLGSVAIALLAAMPAAAIDGAYRFEFLQVETAARRQTVQVRQANGELLFGSSQTLSYNGQPGQSLSTGFGTYRISNPLGDSGASVRMSVSEGEEVMLGVSGGSGADGVFLAVRRPSSAPALEQDATFHGGVFELLPAASPLARSQFVRLQPAAQGFAPGADGTGTIAVPGLGSYRAALSANGNYLIGAPLSGEGGLLFAVRQGAASASGLTFAVSLSVERDALRTALGSLLVETNGSARFSLRDHGPEGVSDLRGSGTVTNFVNGEALLAGHPAGAGPGNSLAAASDDPGTAWLLAAIPVPVATHDGGVFLHPLGIVDAASSAPAGNPLSRNSLVSLYGLRLSESTQMADRIPLPESLGGTRVEVNGRPAGLLLVSPGQINMHMPEDLDGEDVVVQVVSEAGTSAPIRVPLAPSSPGIFSVSQGGLGPAVVTHADYQLVSSASPAQGGEVVIVFLTGLGETQPPPSVMVNGQMAEVLYSGPHSVFVGLYQLNIKLPLFAGADPSAALTLRTREGYSDAVTLAVTP